MQWKYLFRLWKAVFLKANRALHKTKQVQFLCVLILIFLDCLSFVIYVVHHHLQLTHMSCCFVVWFNEECCLFCKKKMLATELAGQIIVYTFTILGFVVGATNLVVKKQWDIVTLTPWRRELIVELFLSTYIRCYSGFLVSTLTLVPGIPGHFVAGRFFKGEILQYHFATGESVSHARAGRCPFRTI